MVIFKNTKWQPMMQAKLSCYIGGGSRKFQPLFRGESLGLCQIKWKGRVKCFLTTTFSNVAAPCTFWRVPHSRFTICCSFYFDRIDSGFNDVKDPDELFTFKKMVKHFKKVKVPYKDKETGQIKEVTTEHCLKLKQLLHSIFSCLYVRL